ncbi:hypothetical protein SEA_KABOCHA_15 [Gordonia phage Kabocha]|uniref:Uncharacterized protein n=1 Tax=Gordonia phage Chidiebere TaxID=2656530 RepID=A0A649VKK8_9CAUD|nr:hypothetical protein PQD14_gp015 [Gordonia phage Chidiebere]AZS07870.1 hypothetical protein PBI_GRAY_15 [Gordonia phage Gray]QGJ92907.1 hypothetical protein PBI_CHIDIEBERE_15 [Gordonia phage Chidiebere]WAA19802.1 hypothetical protein SEA_KABOCHA_15 [Gordonia phage Kabocha]WAA19993.1 hypothetical protein SEA_HANEM_15 [Gordonia phage Hanem]
MTTHTARTWLLISATGLDERQKTVSSVSINAIRASKPSTNENQIAIPVNIEVDDSLFFPEAVDITLSAQDVARPEVKAHTGPARKKRSVAHD